MISKIFQYSVQSLFTHDKLARTKCNYKIYCLQRENVMSSLGIEIVFLKWTDPSKVLQSLATLVSMGSGSISGITHHNTGKYAA